MWTQRRHAIAFLILHYKPLKAIALIQDAITFKSKGGNYEHNNIEALVERIAQRVDSNASAIQVISQAVVNQQQQINLVSEAIDRLANVQLQLGQIIDNQPPTISQQQAAINAELERQGRILDYLMRRDRNSGTSEWFDLPPVIIQIGD